MMPEVKESNPDFPPAARLKPQEVVAILGM